MTVPQSVLVVALAVAWLIVLVPSSSRRRKAVREAAEGHGFRVLRRGAITPMRRRKLKNRTLVAAGKVEDQMPVDPVDVEVQTEPGQRADAGPVQLALVDTAELSARDEAIDDDAVASATSDADGATPVAEAEASDQIDDEVRAEYQAWRETVRPAAEDQAAAPARPARRPGRGNFDPEAADKARAFKYARRRRVVLALVMLVAGFTVAAVALSSQMWIGAAISGALLLLFLTYLRRQVRIEEQIRARRMERLERARQIRPELEGFADRPESARPVQVSSHRSRREVVDLEDDDPSFDDLEQFEPVEYRRAVGQ